MWWILLIIILVVAFYHLYLKDYFEVKKIFNVLSKTLDTRDLLVMKLMPEIKNKNEKAEIIKLIESRMKRKKSRIYRTDEIRCRIKWQAKKGIF